MKTSFIFQPSKCWLGNAYSWFCLKNESVPYRTWGKEMRCTSDTLPRNLSQIPKLFRYFCYWRWQCYYHQITRVTFFLGSSNNFHPVCPAFRNSPLEVFLFFFLKFSLLKQRPHPRWGLNSQPEIKSCMFLLWLSQLGAPPWGLSYWCHTVVVRVLQGERDLGKGRIGGEEMFILRHCLTWLWQLSHPKSEGGGDRLDT